MTPEAGLRLDRLEAKQWNDLDLLDTIYTAIESGEMPPEEAPKHPSLDQSKALQKVLDTQLRALAEKQNPGMQAYFPACFPYLFHNQSVF